MKRFALFLMLSTMSVAATAQNAVPNPVEDPAITPTSDTAATAQLAPKEQAASKNEASDRNCLKETGSRIAPRPDSKGRKCVNASGRSYTKGDLDSTGAVDLNDALRRLDPAVH